MRYRTKIICFLMISLFSPTKASSEELPGGKIRLALLPANDHNQELNNMILEETSKAFFQTKRFTLAERHQLDKIIEEKSLAGFVGALNGDPTAAGLEKLNTVDMVGIVSYTTEQESKDHPIAFWISVRLISVVSSDIVAIIDNRRDTLLVPATPHEAADLLFQSIREEFPPQGHIIKIDGNTVWVDIGKEMGLSDGDRLEVMEEGETIFRESGLPIEIEGETIGTLRITRATNGSSMCKLKKSARTLTTADIVRLKTSDQKVMGSVNKIRKVFRRKNEVEN